MDKSIERQMDALARALERGDIDDKEYDEAMDALIKYANGG